MIEADHDDLLGHMLAGQCLDHSLLDARVIQRRIFDLDIDDRAAGTCPGKDFVQGRNSLPSVRRVEPRPGVKLLQLRERVVLYQSMPVGRTVNRLIVNNREGAIAREVDIQFDPICAKLERVLERGDGVFGTVAHRAAVADHPDAPALLDQALPERQAFSWCVRHTMRC